MIVGDRRCKTLLCSFESCCTASCYMSSSHCFLYSRRHLVSVSSRLLSVSLISSADCTLVAISLARLVREKRYRTVAHVSLSSLSTAEQMARKLASGTPHTAKMPSSSLRLLTYSKSVRERVYVRVCSCDQRGDVSIEEGKERGGQRQKDT